MKFCTATIITLILWWRSDGTETTEGPGTTMETTQETDPRIWNGTVSLLVNSSALSSISWTDLKEILDKSSIPFHYVFLMSDQENVTEISVQVKGETIDMTLLTNVTVDFSGNDWNDTSFNASQSNDTERLIMITVCTGEESELNVSRDIFEMMKMGLYGLYVGPRMMMTMTMTTEAAAAAAEGAATTTGAAETTEVETTTGAATTAAATTEATAATTIETSATGTTGAESLTTETSPSKVQIGVSDLVASLFNLLRLDQTSILKFNDPSRVELYWNLTTSLCHMFRGEHSQEVTTSPAPDSSSTISCNCPELPQDDSTAQCPEDSVKWRDQCPNVTCCSNESVSTIGTTQESSSEGTIISDETDVPEVVTVKIEVIPDHQYSGTSAIVALAMIVLASTVACIVYRKRIGQFVREKMMKRQEDQATSVRYGTLRDEYDITGL